MTLITETPPAAIGDKRVDFVKSEFDDLIWKKGYDVIHEKSLTCPCASKNTNQLSNCKNCGGSGYIFYNPTKTRMVIHSMNLNTKFKEWSKENAGTASVSALSESETSFMDRITVIDGLAIFSEVVFLKNYADSTYYWNTIYDIKEILYIGLFRESDQKLTVLKYGTDFTYENNKIIFITATTLYSDEVVGVENLDLSITVRYKHSPQLHLIDLPRETMQSFVNIAGEGEEVISLPVHAIARRSHYVLNRENFDNSNILDNSIYFKFEDFNPPKSDC